MKALNGSPVEIGSVGPPYFDDHLPTVIVGGGHSLTGFDLEQLRGRAHVIAVKGVIFDLPWADCGAGIDHPRLIEWQQRLDDVSMPVYWAVTPSLIAHDKVKRPKSVTFLQKLEGFKISTDPSKLNEGGTSGFGALGVAVHKRAKDIVLLGFDYDGPQKNWHRNGGHYKEHRHQQLAAWAIWARSYDVAVPGLKALGVRVRNASPKSRITAFEKITLAQALDHLHRVGCAGSGCVRSSAGEHAATPHSASPDQGAGAG